MIGTGDGETHYWIPGGRRDRHGGRRRERPDATITQSYDTAVALAKSELYPVTGFMPGKIKIDGNMGMLLGLQGAFCAPGAMAAIDVEY